MTPIEAAASVIERGTVIRSQDCRRLAELTVTAFLDAAAGDKARTITVGLAANGKYGVSLTEMGHAAITALKEAL